MFVTQVDTLLVTVAVMLSPLVTLADTMLVSVPDTLFVNLTITLLLVVR